MKEKEIKKELNKLKKIYSNIPENKRKLVQGLIENAAFMKATLDELQAQVNEEGPILTSVNGNGFNVTAEHPAQKSYNTMVNRYSAIIKQLNDLLPEEEKKANNSKLDAFLNE